MNFSSSLLFLFGYGAGFFFTIWILGFHYDNLMKKAIDEIHKGYIKALKIQEDKIRKEYERS